MPRFDVLTFPFHRDAITGMDTCIRKPLIATCSMDKSVRIWNFESGYAIYTIGLYNHLNSEVLTILNAY